MRTLAAALVAVLLLSGCEDTTPPSEVTVTHVTECQEDDPCWVCTPEDDACETRG